MRNRIGLTVIVLILAGSALVENIFAQQDAELKATRISPNIVQISGVENIVYSPSGKFLAIQAGSKFVLAPAQNASKSFDNLPQMRRREGEIVGFLPSDALVYSADEKLFALDPVSQTSRRLLSQGGVKRELEKHSNRETFLVVSNDLVISGSGEADGGGFPGNIYRYDLRRKRVTKGPRISQFSSPKISPSGKYILYDHGASTTNNADLYDIRLNRNHKAADYFSLRKAFPKFKKTTEIPLMWIEGQDRFLAFIETGEHPDDIKPHDAEQNKNWLVLFDAPTGKIVWKKIIDRSESGFSSYEQLDADRVLLGYEEKGVYELFLKDGSERKNPNLEGKSLAVSPDKKRIAYIKSNQLFVSAIDGSHKKLILDLPPEGEPHEYYQNLALSAPTWSKSGDALVFWEDNKLLIIQL